MVDVDAAAADNAAQWRQRADAVCSGDPVVNRFRETCRDVRFGTNVEGVKLGYGLSLDPPQLVSSYSFRAATEGADAANSAVYERRPWGPRRAAVEDGLGCRERAIYGSLDLPRCVGNEHYGPYRVVYEPTPTADAVLLPHNSASHYARDGALDTSQVEREVARWDERADVAVAERGERATVIDESLWPLLVADVDATSATEADLIEVIDRRGNRPVGDVDEVRVAASVHDSLVEKYLVAIAGSAATASVDQAVLAAGAIGHASDAGVIKLDVVAGA